MISPPPGPRCLWSPWAWCNNELKELEAREQKEIDRILRQLSAACAAQMENILWDYDILVHLDVIFARAQLSYQLNASRPEVRRRGGVTLRRARHPLLDQARAVPITVELGQQFDTLVITGPNTGGKTVTLKTIGLLIFWVLLVMAIMSWVSQGRSPIEYVLIQLADPLLRPIRRLLPAMGGIDFSPMILVLLLYVINMGVAEVLQATGNMLLPGLWMAL